MADKRERLYIDTEKFTANEAGPEAVGIAMDLITRVWFPAKTARAVGAARDDWMVFE